VILGLSVHTFTVIHVLISLVGIVAGVIVAFAMVQGKSVPGWTALALLALILTSVTGFFFHDPTFTPAEGVGVISLVVLAVAVIALYFLHLTGIWRWIYVIAAMVAIYLNVFVGVIPVRKNRFPGGAGAAPDGAAVRRRPGHRAGDLRRARFRRAANVPSARRMTRAKIVSD
jgi:hypothetical protein